jgi:hypothetical protein
VVEIRQNTQLTESGGGIKVLPFYSIRKLLPILFSTQLLLSCGLVEEPTTTVTCGADCSVVESSAFGGKLAQSYVKDAQVWADQLVDGVGNLQWDEGEPLAISAEDGSYQLDSEAPWILSGDFQIVTSGGKKSDSNGLWIDAAPMLAPAPLPSQKETNVTPLTTLVAFKPALKKKLEALGGWNADIASPSGVSANLLRLAKTVETLSSTLSGGSNPMVNDFGSSLKSLGKLATELNSVDDLTDDTALKESASKAITAVVSDPTIVPNPPTPSQRTALSSSLEKAVEGITAAIPAGDEVVVETTLLSKIEDVLAEAGIDEGVSVRLNMGGGSVLNFGALITRIEMSLDEDSLVLTANVPDDDPSSLEYNWFVPSQPFRVIDNSQPNAKILDFSETDLEVSLTIIDAAANNFVNTRTCTWQGNPTVCEF